jgi:hypothetical protein
MLIFDNFTFSIQEKRSFPIQDILNNLLLRLTKISELFIMSWAYLFALQLSISFSNPTIDFIIIFLCFWIHIFISIRFSQVFLFKNSYIILIFIQMIIIYIFFIFIVKVDVYLIEEYSLQMQLLIDLFHLALR